MEKVDYSATLNLPKSDFPMRANLPSREPKLLEKWEEEGLYQTLMEQDKPLFILHDGPPFANGDIHTGHTMNKILKDFVLKYKTMTGYRTPMIHGWDTHGLPIEQQAIKKLGVNRAETGPVEFRNICRDFALKYVKNQKEQMKRLGVMGDWDHEYITLQPEFEAKEIEVFGEMAKKGLLYRGLKPVYWCPTCETALAEAEIEYDEDTTDSIYVKFALKDDKGLLRKHTGTLDNVYFVIWTTTTWTLPGNVAIAVNPAFSYALVKCGEEYYVVAADLLENVAKAANLKDYEVIATLSGDELENMTCRHPFLDRESLVILGDHVTLEAGTGCVHTAPGHGAEDFIACQNYDLPIVVPVDDKGTLNDLAGSFAGLYYLKANKVIAQSLKESGHLLAIEAIEHQYPHCWRCKDPIIFRATEQWFASVDAIKEDAIKAINETKWVPAWGQERITNMVQDRNDWCISRQRLWGVPLPIFYCKECGKEIITDETIKAVRDLFAEKGSSAWYELSAEEILPEGFACGCGCKEFTKESDIMDVWFDSGSSHFAVLEQRDNLTWPADLYLEGNDQYRGWFQSSLLTSVAVTGKAPYKTVLTHGMVVDGEGKKMSKSLGNGLDPMKLIGEYGADILRLWVASADYRSDVRISKDILKQMSEVYRKIRNTAKYILGNISDFDPSKDQVAFSDMPELDRWALITLNGLVKKVMSAYEGYDYHIIYHSIHNFCVVDMSNFYLDVIKDRLYTQKADSLLRRSAQTAMYLILDALTRMLAPILAFTSEEIWGFMPHSGKEETGSVLLNPMPSVNPAFCDDELMKRWEKILSVRSDVSKALEVARVDKVIGHSLNAAVALYAEGETYRLLKQYEEELSTIFIVSEVTLTEGRPENGANKAEQTGNLWVSVSAAPGEKCERCWMYSETVGEDHLCQRCRDTLQ